MAENAIKVEISNPIEIDGEQVYSLTFRNRKLNVADARKIMDGASGEIDTAIRAIAALANIPMASAEQIALEDLEAINEAIAPLLRVSPVTGKR